MDIACNKAIKLLTQYQRLAEKFGTRLRPDDVRRLDQLRDSERMTVADLPGILQREFPGEFKS